MNILLFAGFMLADLATTAVGLKLGLSELNPLAGALGINAFLLIKVVATVTVVLLTWRLSNEISRRGLHLLTLVLAVVSFSNSLHILAL
jgi:hypothetical protein